MPPNTNNRITGSLKSPPKNLYVVKQNLIYYLLFLFKLNISLAQTEFVNWKRDFLLGDLNGLRSNLHKKGINLSIDADFEFFSNIHNGERRGTLFQGLVSSAVEIDLEKLINWRGGYFKASSFWIFDSEPHEKRDLKKMVGTYFLEPSNISAYDTFRLYALWFQQELFNGKLKLRLGQLAADEDFVVSDFSSLYLSGSSGWPVFMSETLPGGGPGYPLSSPGLELISPVFDAVTIKFGIFTGNPGQQDGNNRYGTRFSVDEKNGFLFIQEIVYEKKNDSFIHPGTYKLGVWYHSGDFYDLRVDENNISLADDGTLSGSVSSGNPLRHNGNYGVYFITDQQLWRENMQDNQGLNFHLRIAPYLPGDRNSLDFYVDGGLQYVGLFPQRDKDVTGFIVHYCRASKSFIGYKKDLNSIRSASGLPVERIKIDEASVEFTYQFKISPCCIIQPCVQYYIHPIASPKNNAIAAGLRLTLSF